MADKNLSQPPKTPMMRQYWAVKEEYPHDIVLFHLGDFYEMFFDDARVASEILDIALTSRNKQDGEPIPMCGVPYHAASQYISRLLQAGKRVVLCDQMQDPREAKGLVERGVTRVLSPGVALSDQGLAESAPNYLIALSGLAIAVADVSTGEMQGTISSSEEELCDELLRLGAAEVLVASDEANREIVARLKEKGLLVTVHKMLPQEDAKKNPLQKSSAYVQSDKLERLCSSSSEAAGQVEKLLVLDSASLRSNKNRACDAYGRNRASEESADQGDQPETSSTKSTDIAERRVQEFEQAVNQSPLLKGLSGDLFTAGTFLLSYLREAHRTREVSHLKPLQFYDKRKFLILDENARLNLELFRTLRDGEKEGSLLGILDQTRTPMGARKLLSWLKAPLREEGEIEKRLDAVEELVRNESFRRAIRLTLKEIRDLERICSRLVLGSSNARDFCALRASLAPLPKLKELCRDLSAELLSSHNGSAFLSNTLDRLREELDLAFVEEPPLSVKEGGMFRRGYSAELDEWVDLSNNGKAALAKMESGEREKTGISSLKVRYNNVFGYYIEVTKANLNFVPPHYIRKQTIANGERYFTEELKALEEKIMTAEEKRSDLEYQLFSQFKERFISEVQSLLDVAQEVALLDVLSAFAKISALNRYVRPEICAPGPLEIREGRHPVVEQTLPGGEFVSNDVVLDVSVDQGVDQGGESFLIITGPNMAGKSTIMRQTALIVMMAQIGCFVPARSARIGMVDRIFTRIGASDDLSGGKSTFMVEMTETATILREATRNSLILLDEIGRGTSARDGFAIAWAVAREIADQIGAKTLFATHYAELSRLSEGRPHVANYSVAVARSGEEIVFLHQLVQGATSQSYGIEVAALAGIPERVIEVAKCKLREVPMMASKEPASRQGEESDQLRFFS